MDLIPIMKPWLGVEESAAVAEAIASGWVAQGPRVTAFEEAVRKRVLATHAVAVSSCTAALHLCMHILGVGPGDEVILPSLSFIATANAPCYTGARPVFADVDEQTQNLTPSTIERMLSPAARAVIVVHQGGVPADIEAIRALCDAKGVAVVEDAACAMGSTYRSKPIGAHSDLVAFSFHPRKLITTGEGGMIMTTRQDWADRFRRLREHGMGVSAAARHASKTLVVEEYVEIGFNYRMSDIQAAVGLVQLSRLDAIIARRRERARLYQEALADLPGLQVVQDPAYGQSNYQSFWIILPDDFPVSRNALLALLLERGISARRGIMAAHLEPAFVRHPRVELPVTERLTRQSLLLPLFHTMSDADQDHVVAVVREAAGVAA